MIDEKIKKMELEQKRINEFNKKIEQIKQLKYKIDELKRAHTYAKYANIYVSNDDGGVKVDLSVPLVIELIDREAELKTEQLNKLIKEVEEY